MPHTHMHALLTYFRYSVSKTMKVIVNTFLISLGNVPNFTSALVSITAQSAGAKEWIQLKKKIVQAASSHHLLKSHQKEINVSGGLGRLPQHIIQMGFCGWLFCFLFFYQTPVYCLITFPFSHHLLQFFGSSQIPSLL